MGLSPTSSNFWPRLTWMSASRPYGPLAILQVMVIFTTFFLFFFLWISFFSGDGSELRDHVISHGIVKPLLALIVPGTSETFLRNAVWTVSNLCRNKSPSPKVEVMKQVLPKLKDLLSYEDNEILGTSNGLFSFEFSMSPMTHLQPTPAGHCPTCPMGPMSESSSSSSPESSNIWCVSSPVSTSTWSPRR